MPLSQAVVLQGTTAVGFLLQDDRVDQLTSFHATQRQQPIGPGVRCLADEFCNGVGPLDARLLPQFQVGINNPSGLAIFLAQVPQLIDRNRRPVAAHPDRGEPLFQVARLPFTRAVVPPLQQVA